MGVIRVGDVGIGGCGGGSGIGDGGVRCCSSVSTASVAVKSSDSFGAVLFGELKDGGIVLAFWFE